jgi:putative transposase
MEPSAPHRKRNKKYNVPGHAHFLTFSCYGRTALLTNDMWREWLAASIRKKCDQYEIALWAYVFMPEHIHLLLKPRHETYDLAEFEQSAKLSWTRKMITHLSRSRSPLLEKLRVNEGYKIWQEGGGHDLNIWTMKKAIEKAQYCHNNPVKRRLVKSPELWRWSSYRWLELGKRENEPLRTDDWDESLLPSEPPRTRLNGETGGTQN